VAFDNPRPSSPTVSREHYQDLKRKGEKLEEELIAERRKIEDQELELGEYRLQYRMLMKEHEALKIKLSDLQYSTSSP